MECDSEQLVAAIMKRPALYDHSLKQHSNRILINKMWNEVAVEMKCTAVDCKARWLRLRSAYSRYLREGRSTPQGRQKRKWYMAEQMSFLEKHISLQQRARSPISPKPENSIEISPSNTDFDDDSNASYYQSSSRPPTSKKSKTSSVTDIVAAPLVEYLRLKAEQTQTEDDPESMFFKSMLADYKNITQRRKRYFRELMVTTMNKLQEDDENDQMQSHVCHGHRDSVEVKSEEV